MIAAEKYSVELQEIVVISADSTPIDQNQLGGLIIDTPRRKDAALVGGLFWHNAIRRYLKGFGFNESELSKKRIPTEKDVKTVSNFCRWRIGAARKPEIHWEMDKYGKLNLHWNHDNEYVISEKDILAFFSHPDWVQSLPSSHKRYRLTAINDTKKHPFYIVVKLADIPSFKGLEANGVIFIYEGFIKLNDYQLKSNLYIALSRAKHLLHIVSPYSILEKVHELQNL
jgi:hypothetical protein